jgi:hypothetical protein
MIARFEVLISVACLWLPSECRGEGAKIS